MNISLPDINNINFWVKALNATRDMNRKSSIAAGNTEKTVSLWNNRAENFAKNTRGEESLSRQQEVLSFLEYCGVPLDGINVLDIGCGPGNYTLPLAKRAAHVLALDPAPAMLDILKERAGKDSSVLTG